MAREPASGRPAGQGARAETFDYAGHWGGDHHGVPIFVPTRGTPPEPQSGWVHYVPDAATAMREAKTAAGEQDVMVHGAGLAQSLLREGLLDELEIHLIPAGRSAACPAPADYQATAHRNVVKAPPLWSLLENAGAPVTVRESGMLFDDRRPDGNKTEER